MYSGLIAFVLGYLEQKAANCAVSAYSAFCRAIARNSAKYGVWTVSADDRGGGAFMRFETGEIVIETVEGGQAILVYPNPIKRNVRAVWKGAPADCTKAGRGLRIDFTEPPKLELRLEQAGKLPADDDNAERLIARFLEAQAAYFAGDITLETV